MTHAIEVKKITPSDPEWVEGKCNARRRSGGYCRNTAGFKTAHVGSGRCYLHGGCGGRPPKNAGIYAAEFTQTLAEKADAIRQHPDLFNIYAELALLKTMIGSIIGVLPEDVHEWFEDGMDVVDGKKTRIGPDNLSKIKLLIQLQDSVRKTFRTMVDAETRAKSVLSFNDLMSILEQVRMIIDGVCKDCPHRAKIKASILDGLRVPETPIIDADYEVIDPTGAMKEAEADQRRRERDAARKRKSRREKKERTRPAISWKRMGDDDA